MGLVAERRTDRPLKVAGVVRHEVGQRAELRVAPPRFHRVEFHRVSRQPFDIDTWDAGCGKLSGGRAMHTPAIPNDDQRPPKTATQLFHEVDRLAGANVLVVNLEGSADATARRREGNRPNHAQPVVAVPSTLHWRFTTRCPSATVHRLQAKTSFINEYNTGATSPGFF